LVLLMALVALTLAFAGLIYLLLFTD